MKEEEGRKEGKMKEEEGRKEGRGRKRKEGKTMDEGRTMEEDEGRKEGEGSGTWGLMRIEGLHLCGRRRGGTIIDQSHPVLVIDQSHLPSLFSIDQPNCPFLLLTTRFSFFIIDQPYPPVPFYY